MTTTIQDFSAAADPACMRCGKPIDKSYAHDDGYCGSCSAIKWSRARNRSHMQKIVPSEFSEMDLDKLKSKCGVQTVRCVLAWKPTKERPFLILHGKPRMGKSRLLWLLLKREIIMSGARPRTFESLQFSEELSESWNTRGTSSLMSETRKADWVVFDDFDKEPLSNKVAPALFSIIDYRCTRNLPMIFTMNVVDDGLLSKFSDPILGEAMLGRLEEFSVAIAVTKKTASE